MQYRTFGKLAWRPSALGFGAMRLPVIGGDPGQIDEPEATRMLRYAIDHGVNYVDTAYPYHRGTSEGFVGRALRDGYRERIKLATKLPCWLVKEPADFDRYLDEQLERLQSARLRQMPSVDFYLLHSLDAERWHAMHDLGVLDWAERAMADGRIGHLGFSFHDKYEVFQEIVDAYDGWTFCQVQYNYMDEQEQAGVKGLKYAAGRELAVVVMEPLRGGLLAGNIPQPVQELWDSAAPPAVAGLPTKPLPAVAGLPTKPLPAVAGLLTEPLPAVAGLPTEPLPAVAGLPTEPQRNTPADRALQWVWNQPEVSLLLSGMSTMQQVVENVASAGRSAPGSLTAADLALIARVRDKYRELAPIPCTNCKYCQPCPNGVSIPRVFEAYNEAIMYNNASHARLVYSQWFSPEERADRCLRCGECEAACPQQIPIMEWLEKAHQFLIATLPTTARS